MERTFHAPTAAGVAGTPSRRSTPNDRPVPGVRDAVLRTLIANGGEMPFERLAWAVAARTNRPPTTDWVREFERTHLPSLVEEGLLVVSLDGELTVSLRPVAERARYAGP